MLATKNLQVLLLETIEFFDLRENNIWNFSVLTSKASGFLLLAVLFFRDDDISSYVMKMKNQ